MFYITCVYILCNYIIHNVLRHNWFSSVDMADLWAVVAISWKVFVYRGAAHGFHETELYYIYFLLTTWILTILWCALQNKFKLNEKSLCLCRDIWHFRFSFKIIYKNVVGLMCTYILYVYMCMYIFLSLVYIVSHNVLF